MVRRRSAARSGSPPPTALSCRTARTASRRAPRHGRRSMVLAGCPGSCLAHRRRGEVGAVTCRARRAGRRSAASRTAPPPAFPATRGQCGERERALALLIPSRLEPPRIIAVAAVEVVEPRGVEASPCPSSCCAATKNTSRSRSKCSSMAACSITSSPGSADSASIWLTWQAMARLFASRSSAVSRSAAARSTAGRRASPVPCPHGVLDMRESALRGDIARDLGGDAMIAVLSPTTARRARFRPGPSSARHR